MTVEVEKVTRDELMALVDERRDEVRAFVDWAESHETGIFSMYLANRPDLPDAREAASLYPNAWWGVVVFTCFGSLNSARAVRQVLSEPVDADTADQLLASVSFTRPTVGHHRIQQGLAGAKKALVAACGRNDLLHEVLYTRRSFDDRYQRLRDARLARWGRTTCFDLLLRTGALGIGGQRYEPEIAYLAGSTGPKVGFRTVWGRNVSDETATWCEGLLQAWHRHWSEVVDRVGSRWSGRPYAPGDLENALCIHQERR
jgi:hypothetical protein